MKKIPVLHIVDTLSPGGAEHMAVNLVNALLDSPYTPHLCVTRRVGPLKERVHPDVGFLHLDRKNRFDLRVLKRYIDYVSVNDIRLIHAHSTSIFFALLSGFFLPDLPVIWHVHGVDLLNMPHYKKSFYRWASRRAKGIACVSEELVQWAVTLKESCFSIWYLPNFIPHSNVSTAREELVLPKYPCVQVICVSNLKIPKDHFTLLEAWKLVVKHFPCSHLFLVGGAVEKNYAHRLLDFMEQLNLDGHVILLGQRSDIPALLMQFQVGVLSSHSEGFPVTLLEYGAAKLGVVATNVGQCAEILDHGKAGLLVPPGDVDALANALLALLIDPSLRKELGLNLFEYVVQNYTRDPVLQQLFKIYTESIRNRSQEIS